MKLFDCRKSRQNARFIMETTTLTFLLAYNIYMWMCLHPSANATMFDLIFFRQIRLVFAKDAQRLVYKCQQQWLC